MGIFPEIDSKVSTHSTVDTSIKEIGEIVDMEFNNNTARVIVKNGRPVMATTLKRKIEVFAQMLLRTEVNKFNVYKLNNFGVDYFRFIGRGDYPFSFIRSEIEKTIKEKLLMFRGIKSVIDFKATLEMSKLNIEFTVISIEDDIININESGINE